jgi:hypothetical protein
MNTLSILTIPSHIHYFLAEFGRAYSFSGFLRIPVDEGFELGNFRGICFSKKWSIFSFGGIWSNLFLKK